jgi:hypothetical protein
VGTLLIEDRNKVIEAGLLLQEISAGRFGGFFLHGWIRRRQHKSGDIWVYCHRRRRWDGKLVEATGIRLGTVTEIPSEEAAWKRVDELGLKPYSADRPRDPRITFGEVAAHYVKFGLPDDQTKATIEKSQSTIKKYKHYLNRWVLPKWHSARALSVPPFEVEDWLKQIEREHRLESSTLAEIRKIMNLVYRHGQRHGILPRTDEGNPMLFVQLPGDRNSTGASERESVA